MALEEYYKKLIAVSGTSFDELLNSGAMPLQTQSHNYMDDYQKMRNLVKDRPESVMIEYAIVEYQFGLYATATGMYRHAFSSLRLFFELFLGAIEFSSQEIKFWKWHAEEQDVVWSSIINKETGVFSANFVRAFFPALQDNASQYRAIAETAYRQCSEYVHGNARTQSDDLTNVGFKKEPFAAWHDLAESIHLAITFAFCARFAGLAPPDFRNDLQPIATDHLGHLPAIQSLYQDPQ